MFASYDGNCDLPKPVCKLLQRQLYDVVSSRIGCLILTVLLLLVSLSCIHLAELFAPPAQDRNFNDNLLNQRFGAEFTNQDLPVDVVYTWVNGSDESFLTRLHEAKYELQRQLRIKNDSSLEQPCTNARGCFISNFLIIHPPIDSIKLNGLVGISRMPYASGDNVTIAEFESTRTARKYFESGIAGYEVKEAFYTYNLTEFNIESNQAAFFTVSANENTEERLANYLKEHEKGVITSVIHRTTNLISEPSTLFFLNLDDQFGDDFDSMEARLNSLIQPNTITLSKLRLRHHSDNIIPPKDISTSRYVDNEELRYSLRSIERYAPWVRHIFLVTNGQIPSWIDMESSRLTIVAHEDIYPDLSHLPTFSSPSIESHLHKIPGLADNFLYFNDDVMLNQPVWPEDFHDRIHGTKIRLAWAIPACHSSCPNAWISDGYCDRICNTKECDFDGGDCLTQNAAGLPDSSWTLPSDETASKLLCSAGCMKSWMADKFCDPLCDVVACGFDLGDCGVARFAQLHQVELNELSDQKIMIQERHKNFYFNYTNAHIDSITSAELNSTDTLIWASVQTQFNIIPVVIDPNCSTAITFHMHLDFVKHNQTHSAEIVVMLPARTDEQHQPSPTPVTTMPTTLSVNIIGNREPVQRSGKMEAISESELHSLMSRANQSNSEELKTLINDKEGGFLTDNGFAKKLSALLKITDDSDPHVMLRKLQSFEWEKEPEIKQIGRQLAFSNSQSPFRSRHLLDTFGDSLKYVNRLYNAFFGFNTRKVIAHMPHMINRQIMQDLQADFSEEFEQTSKNRIRSTNDMQFAFAYFYYLREVRLEISLDEIFAEFDTDLSGVLSDRELRLFVTKTTELPIRLDYLTKLETELKNCSAKSEKEILIDKERKVEEYYDKEMPQISRFLFTHCPHIVDKLEQMRNGRRKYKSTELDDDEIEFQMIGSNVSSVIGQLDHIRKNQKKFLCVNDDMDHGGSGYDATVIKALLHDMYETLYPFPSQFELPQYYRNRFLYLHDFREWKSQKNRLLCLAHFFIVILVLSFLSPRVPLGRVRRIIRNLFSR